MFQLRTATLRFLAYQGTCLHLPLSTTKFNQHFEIFMPLMFGVKKMFGGGVAEDGCVKALNI